MRLSFHRLLCSVVVAALPQVYHAKPSLQVEQVHPLNWWAGMKDPHLQILIHGKNLSACQPSLAKAQGISLERVIRVDNPDYLILYVNTREAQPQTFDIVLKKDGVRPYTISYELQPRKHTWQGGFDASDVVYLLMPDRFANGNTDNDGGMGLADPLIGRNEPFGRHGGDIAGINNHLDYLEDLGISAIWTTPILTNDMPGGSYHGYAITDYYHIDPRFGTNEEFAAFVDNCHHHGIKYIMDLVFNHCGSECFLFKNLPASDWFNNNSIYKQTNYKLGTLTDPHSTEAERLLATDGWFTKEMPDFNQRNPLVMDYLIQTSIWWTEYAGIDGVRQDTYPYCDTEAMARWNQRMELEYPGYNIVGETWINYNVGVAPWQTGSKLSKTDTQLKTVMDFPLMYLLGSVCDEETDDWDHGFARLWDYFSQDGIYADPLHLFTFLSNHDTDRFCPTEEKAQNIDRYRQALAILLFARGIPQLYYGDEIGLWSNKQHGDGLLRQDFPGGWPDDVRNAFTPQGRTEAENERYNFTRRLLHFRQNNRAISEGSMKQFTVKDGIWCFARQKDDNTVTVILNGTSKEQTVDLTRFAEVLPKNQACEVISNQQMQLADSVKMPPRGILVLSF